MFSVLSARLPSLCCKVSSLQWQRSFASRPIETNQDFEQISNVRLNQYLEEHQAEGAAKPPPANEPFDKMRQNYTMEQLEALQRREKAQLGSVESGFGNANVVDANPSKQKSNQRKGFAAMPKERLREIARKGGQHSHTGRGPSNIQVQGYQESPGTNVPYSSRRRRYSKKDGESSHLAKEFTNKEFKKREAHERAMEHMQELHQREGYKHLEDHGNLAAGLRRTTRDTLETPVQKSAKNKETVAPKQSSQKGKVASRQRTQRINDENQDVE